jgi:predicted nucleic acid-binding Zn ribbon protein
MNKKYPSRNNRQAEVHTLKEVIEEMLTTYKLRGKYNETRLISSWEKIMGKPIASRTLKLFIKDKKLYVKLNSAPLKNELNLSKTKVLDLLHAEIGHKVLEDILFL